MKSLIFPVFVLCVTAIASAHIWEEIGTTSGCPDQAEISLPQTVDYRDGKAFFSMYAQNRALPETDKCYSWTGALEGSGFWLHSSPDTCIFNMTSEKINLLSGKGNDFEISLGTDCLDGLYELGIRFVSDTLHVNREVYASVEVEDSGIREIGFSMSPRFDISFAAAVDPELIELEQGSSSQFNVFIRNADNMTMHNLTLKLLDSPFSIEVEPEVIDELKPQEVGYYSVKITIPEDAKMGKHVLTMDIESDEFPVSFTKHVFIFVSGSRVIYYLSAIVVVVVLILIAVKVYRSR